MKIRQVVRHGFVIGFLLVATSGTPAGAEAALALRGHDPVLLVEGEEPASAHADGSD